MEQLKKRLDDTDIPALTDQFEKKKREFDDIERRLRNKEADINDLSRERQHFSARVEEMKAEAGRITQANQQIDADTAAAKEQIESGREVIRGIEERQKEFSGELETLRARHSQVSDAIRESEKKILEFDYCPGTDPRPAGGACLAPGCAFRGRSISFAPRWGMPPPTLPCRR